MKNDITDNFSDESEVQAIYQMAIDALITLHEYSTVLKDLSIATSELVGNTDFKDQSLKLIEGIETFIDSVAQIKVVLNRRLDDRVTILESDLISILKDLVESQEKGDWEYAKLLLKTYLPDNLIQWQSIGIPAIEHGNDC